MAAPLVAVKITEEKNEARIEKNGDDEIYKYLRPGARFVGNEKDDYHPDKPTKA